ncbi:hypothetical protein CYFUS_003200 [Cystobacter fuscus]|uniref:Peptidase C58 YopT-type domain-containing protein n=1 Tax=Cystobacter fuscus TaxID=43 RepID=A0A250J1B7_9BACT|nr:hypothetical protein [Cystobacter fuscus]ATB37775.1 hypothetical protein CYFUS_003200 [Cystobacter fuscus]
MTINVKNRPAPRTLNTTSTQAPAKSTPTAKSDAANGTAGASPSPQVQPQKPSASAPPSYHQDQLGKPKAPAQAPSGNAVFQSRQDIATLNSRRGSVFSTRPAQGTSASSAPLATSARQAPAKFQQLATTHQAEITAWSDQANNPTIQNSSEKGGVCAAMVNEWARAGSAGPQQEADFRKRLNDGDTQHFVDLQRTSRQKHEQFIKNDDFLESHPIANHLKSDVRNELKAENDKHNQTMNVAGFKPEDMLFPATKRINSNEHLAEMVSGAMQTAKPLVPEGTSFFAKMMVTDKNQTGGHAIGVKMTHLPGGKMEYSMLDPNTGEFSKIPEQNLKNFMTDHMNKTYGKDYVGGGLSLHAMMPG